LDAGYPAIRSIFLVAPNLMAVEIKAANRPNRALHAFSRATA
jgi:hypothetical protein